MTPIHTSKPFTSNPKNSPAYWLADILWVVHATGDQTQGRFSIIEQWTPNDAFAPPHVHPHEDESFWIIAGEMTVKVGGKTVCRILNYYSPAGFEQAIIGSARPAKRRELPPRGLDPHDSPPVVRYFNNYWVAPANVPWALLKFEPAD